MAQAAGATYSGKSAAAYGNAAILSLDPTKTIYAVGKGGIIFTNDDTLAGTARSIRSHGSSGPNLHKLVGLNATMQEMPAMTAVLNLRNIDAQIQRRQQIADLYQKFLGGIPRVSLPQVGEHSNHTYWQYVIRVPKDRRSALFDFLKQRRIENWQGFGPGIFYPLPMHAQKSMLDLGIGSPLGTGRYPVVEEYTQEFISLPIFPQMTDAQIRYVAKAVRDFFAAVQLSSESSDKTTGPGQVVPQRVFLYSWGGPVVENLVETLLRSKHQLVGVVAIDAGWNKEFLRFLKERNVTVILLPAGFDKPGINRRIADDPNLVESLRAIGDQIRQWNADVGMVMQFSQVPDIFLNSARKMTVNFHPSDLPNYRGVRPRHMQLFDRRTEFTVTWHQITSALDQGDIVKQIHGIPIYPETDRAIDLYNRFIEPAAQAAMELLDDFGRDSVVPVPQQGKPTRTSWNKDVQLLQKLDFSELSGDEIGRRIRIFYNFFPEVWTQVGEVPFVPDSAELVQAEDNWLNLPTGTLLRYENGFSWWRVSDGVVKVGVRFQDDIFRIIPGGWEEHNLESYKALLEQAMKDHAVLRSELRLAFNTDQMIHDIRYGNQPATVFINAEDFPNLSIAQKNEYLYVALAKSNLRLIVYNENGQVKVKDNDNELDALLKLDRVFRTDQDLSQAIATFSKPDVPNIHLSKEILPNQTLLQHLKKKTTFFKQQGDKAGTLAVALLWAISGGEQSHFFGISQGKDGFWTVVDALVDSLQKSYDTNLVFAWAA